MRALISLFDRISPAHMRSVLDVGYLFGLRLVQKILGLVSFYFLVRVLDQDEFGTYSFIISLVMAGAIFALSGMINAVMQSVARGYLGSYFRAVPVVFCVSFVGSAVFSGVAFMYYDPNDPQLYYGLLIAAALFPFASALKLWHGFVAGQEKFARFAQLEGTMFVLMHGGLVSACLLGVTEIPIFISIIFGVQGMYNVAVLIWHYGHRQREGEEFETGNLSYGIRTSLYDGIFVISEHLDKLLLFTVVSPANLAIYTIADRISELIRYLVNAIASVLSPKFARTDTYTLRLDRMIKIFCIAFGAVCILFSFTLMPPLIIWLFGEGYAASIPIAQGLIVAGVFGNHATLQFRYIRSHMDEESYRHITIATSLILITVSSIFIPLLGLWGAVLSMFLYRVMMALVIHNLIRKRYLHSS